MILRPGECVICKNITEADELLKMLEEDGYRFHHGGALHFASGKYGARWEHDCEYPNCIATLDRKMRDEAESSHTVVCNHFDVITYDEFLSRAGHTDVMVDDLI